MNKCLLLGRLAKEVELTKTKNGKDSVNNCLAVTSSFTTSDGAKNTNWINFSVYGTTAVKFSKFFKKGNRVILEGEWTTSSYENAEGKKVYSNNLVVGNFYFVEEKKKASDDLPF